MKQVEGWISETSTEYFARKEGFINNSLIKEAIISARNLLKDEPVRSESFDFGSAFHKKILEPTLFDEFTILLNNGFDTKSTRKLFELSWDELKDLKGFPDEYFTPLTDIDRIEAEWHNIDDFAFITRKSQELIEKMYQAFIETPKAVELVESCEKEISGYYNVGKFTAKIKPDLINRAERFMVDLKTSTSGQLHSWSKTVEKYHYHVQAGYYCSAADKIDKIKLALDGYRLWKWLVIEKSEPFHVKIIECAPDHLAMGKIAADHGIDVILDAWNNGNYGQNDIEDVTTPSSWLVKQYRGILH